MSERLRQIMTNTLLGVTVLGANTFLRPEPTMAQSPYEHPLAVVDDDFSRRILVGCFAENQIPTISFLDRLTALVDGVKLPFDGGGDIRLEGSAATITDDARERGLVYRASEITEQSRLGVFVRNFIGTQTWQNFARACNTVPQ